jgi:TonB family protein
VAPKAEDAVVGTVVTALLTLSKEGCIEAVKVGHSNTPRFAESVAQAVKHWRFAPARRDGQAIRSLVLVPFWVIPADAQVAMR